MIRRRILSICAAVVVLILLVSLLAPGALWAFVVVGPIVGLAVRDALQREHTVLRNFPLIGHIRYGLESIRPEIQQYLIESSVDAHPIEREFRSLVYQRAKGELDTVAFGTHRDVYATGYEWAAHSMAARHLDGEPPRVVVGGPDCAQPYSSSLLNISAMSFGALSDRAILALSGGARLGGFAHNTGEGGIADQHLEGGGDLIWQIGTGYFGCRAADGGFDAGRFRERAGGESVRMIEIKLSQGAKPGHGGVLPGVKNTPLIARIRGVEPGTTVVSPPAHTAFDSPAGLLEFVARLRELCGGKPVGFKMCIGRRTDFLAICRAMVETGITPDFVTIDGGEGGTGAAPLEFSNSMGMPARDAWILAHSALVGVGLRDRVRIVASGRVFTGFHMIRALAMGADLCAGARGFMLSLGCIQSLRCNTNLCPTGIATQDERLTWGLDVDDKRARVARFQAATVRSFMDLLGSMGLDDPAELAPHHIYRRVDDLRVRHLGELYDYLEPGQLLDDASVPEHMREDWHAARADRWILGPEAGPHGGDTLRVSEAAG